MAYTPYTPVGSNLSDLGRLLEAGEARSAAENLQRMSMMFQNAQKKADLESRRAENEADRKLKYFEVDQRKALQTRSLDMEDKRLQAEAERWFKGHGLKEREVSAYEKQLNAVDPRVARDNALLESETEAENQRAASAAARANALLPSIWEKRAKELQPSFNTAALGFGTSAEEALEMARNKAMTERNPLHLGEIYTALGNDASLVIYDPAKRRFAPVVLSNPLRKPTATNPATVPNPAQQFFGPPLPPAEDVGPVMPQTNGFRFVPQVDLLSPLNPSARPAVAPVLRYNPQTGTFE